MHARLHAPRAALALAALVAGCSTPQVALQQANHTAKLMSLLDAELSEFRRVQQAAQASRVQSMATQKEFLSRLSASAEVTDQARRSAGDTLTVTLREQLISNADGVGQVRQETKSARTDFKKQVDALLVPLPSTRASITDAQAKAAAMGTELSADTRRQELLDFGIAVAESLNEARERIRKAQAEAAATQSAADIAADQAAKSIP
jgi:flagellar basal body L-ring protein FlgH